MKIYILVQGEYEDRHICYVTEDKNKAESFSARHNELYPHADPVCIETHDTDDMPTVSSDSVFYSVYRDYEWLNNNRVDLDSYTVTEEYDICPDCCVVASTPEEAIDIYKEREIARKKSPRRKINMKKITTLIFAGIVMFLMSMILMVSASADEQYIEKEFAFPGYSPVVAIDHGSYDWTLEMRDDGTLKWSKNRDRNNQKQLFDILPTSEAGYFVIREHTYEHSQRVLTYTPDGFVMAYPATDEYGMQTFSRSQMFRFKWVNKRWRLVCAENNICFCNGGWAPVRLFCVNA